MRTTPPPPFRKRSPRFLIPALVFATTLTVLARDWHVTGTGDDANDGKTPATALRTLQKAADSVAPGDTVLLGDGIYTNTDTASGSAVVTMRTSGTPDAWITWKTAPGADAVIRPFGWSGVQVEASYQILDGLKVIGANDSITLLEATTDGVITEKDGKKYSGNPRFNSNGIFINGRRLPADAKPHHIIVRNCEVAKCPGGGITAIEADYVTIEDCRVYENAWFMRYGGSGITFLNNWAYDDEPGYHVVIQRNFVWNNKTLVPWININKLSDGNGILLDVTDGQSGATNPNADAPVAANPTGDTATATAATPTPTPADRPQRPEWKGRALIANNLSAYNGGSGIHTFRTKHVDIINNTTYWNGGVVGYQELFPNRSEDVVILNNIIVPRPGGKVTSNNRNTNVRWDYNIYPVEQDVFVGENDIVADVQFLEVDVDPTRGDFRLANGSKALGSGTDELPQATDILGNKRPGAAGRDRGAFQQ